MMACKKILAAVTAGLLCVSGMGVSGLRQMSIEVNAMASEVENASSETSVVKSPSQTDELVLGVNDKELSLSELKASDYKVTMDITSSREFNAVGVGVYLNDGLEYDEEKGMYPTIKKGQGSAVANGNFVFMPFAYATAPLKTAAPGKFAEISVKVPETAKPGDRFEIQVVGEDSDGTPTLWKNGVTGESGNPVGSSGYVTIVEEDNLVLGANDKEVTLDELKASDYKVTMDITSSREFNAVGVGVYLNDGLEYDEENGMYPTIKKGQGSAAANGNFVFMPFSYATVPLKTAAPGKCAEISVKVPETAKPGDRFEIQVVGEDSDGTPTLWKNGVTGESGNPVGSSGYITIVEEHEKALVLGVNDRELSLSELKASDYKVTMDITSSREFNAVEVGVYLNDGLEYDEEKGMYPTVKKSTGVAIANGNFVFMPFAYAPVPLKTVAPGKFAEISVKVPETAKLGDRFEIQVVGEDSDGTPTLWNDGVTGKTGNPVGSSGYITIVEECEEDLVLGVNNKELSLSELKASDYKVTMDITSSRKFNSVGVGVYLNDGLEYDEEKGMYPTVKKSTGVAIANGNFVFMPFAYAPVPLGTVAPGKFAEISVKVPETAKPGDCFEIQVTGEDSDGTPMPWKDGVTGKTGNAIGSSGYITIVEDSFTLGINNKDVTMDELKSSDYMVTVDLVSNGDVNSFGMGVYLYDGLEYDDMYPTVAKAQGLAVANGNFVYMPFSYKPVPLKTLAAGKFGELTVKVPETAKPGDCFKIQVTGADSKGELQPWCNAMTGEQGDTRGSIGYITILETSDLYDGTYGGLYYKEYDDHMEIVKCDNMYLVSIPEKINGKDVTGISGYQDENAQYHSAFEECTDLNDIIIPNSVTNIESSTFSNCSTVTIYSYANSYAQKFAEDQNLSFKVLNPATTTTTTTSTTTVTTTTTTSSAQTEPTALYGDLNLDGRVDITDAVLLNKACAGAVMLDDATKKNADCNGDSEVGSDDAVVLMQFLVHIVDKLPYQN